MRRTVLEAALGLAAFALPVGLAACAEDGLPPLVAREVGAACEARAGWTRTTTELCLRCQAYAITPACDCPDVARYPSAARCEAEMAGLRASPCADGVLRCRVACAPGDCACVDACYAAEAGCKAAQGRVDACVYESCRLACE